MGTKQTTSTIRHWYGQTYPEDELGLDIAPTVTFDDLGRALDSGTDVYGVIGVGDSVIRERCFEKLADIRQVPYDHVYEAWLRGARARRHGLVLGILGDVA